MARRWSSNVRKIQQSGNNCRYVNIPANIVRELGWRERQKVIVRRRGKKIVIEDWPARQAD